MLKKWSFLCLGSWSWMSLIGKTKSIRSVVGFQLTNWPTRPSSETLKKIVHSIPRKNPQSKYYNIHCRREKKKVWKLRLLTCAHELSTLWSWVSGLDWFNPSLWWGRRERERVMTRTLNDQPSGFLPLPHTSSLMLGNLYNLSHGLVLSSIKSR